MTDKLNIVGEKAGAKNLLLEFNSPILKADKDIKNKNGDIICSISELSLIFSSVKPEANILIKLSEKKKNIQLTKNNKIIVREKMSFLNF